MNCSSFIAGQFSRTAMITKSASPKLGPITSNFAVISLVRFKHRRTCDCLRQTSELILTVSWHHVRSFLCMCFLCVFFLPHHADIYTSFSPNVRFSKIYQGTTSSFLVNLSLIKTRIVFPLPPKGI